MMLHIERIEPRMLLAAGPFIEAGGMVVMEAEHYDANIARGGKSWTPSSALVGFAGSGGMLALPNTGTQIDPGYVGTSPELQYAIKFSTPGTYRVWLRGHAVDGADNSAHVGLDGQAVASADRISGALSTTNWRWFDSTMDGPVATINIASAGMHTINLWMREDGFGVDRILLTTSATLVPSGAGPAESARQTTPPSPPPPTNPNASLDPEIDPPWNIRRLTSSGERAAWSPDGKKIAYISKSFGDAYEIDVATGQQRLLTGFFAHKGFLRVDYLSDGNFLLTGARTFTDANTTRYHDEELWVLPHDLSTPPVALNQKVNEGTAISRIAFNHIAWTDTAGQYPSQFPNGGTGLFTGDIAYNNGVATLVNKKQVYFESNYIDVQDFRDDDRELVFSRYVNGRSAVYGVKLDTKAVIKYRDVSPEYDEAEGIFPDGNSTLVESSRDKGLDHQNPQYIDLWQLSLSDGGKSFKRLVRWGDFTGYKSSNPVVSPDGRYVAFQSARTGETAGIGHGIFILDLGAPGSQGQTIFSDGFGADPAGSGWQISTSATDGSKVSVTSDGSHAVMSKNINGQTTSATMTRTIDTSGFTNISLALTALQSSATFEAADKLKIEIDTGAGFERLLTDGGVWQGIDNASGDDVTAAIGNATPTSTGWLALQSSAANNKSVRIRITGYFSAADEKYFLDSLLVRGTAIA